MKLIKHDWPVSVDIPNTATHICCHSVLWTLIIIQATIQSQYCSKYPTNQIYTGYIYRLLQIFSYPDSNKISLCSLVRHIVFTSASAIYNEFTIKAIWFFSPLPIVILLLVYKAAIIPVVEAVVVTTPGDALGTDNVPANSLGFAPEKNPLNWFLSFYVQ